MHVRVAQRCPKTLGRPSRRSFRRIVLRWCNKGTACIHIVNTREYRSGGILVPQDFPGSPLCRTWVIAMADPSTAFAAVQLLLSTLHRVSTIITNLKNAPARVQDLKRDCDFTRMLLRTIRCEDTNHDQTDARSPVNIQRLLRGTVRQLKSEVDELLQELEKLPKSESKIGRWMANGVVVWKGSYLDGMQQKIRAKQGHLHLVLQS